MRIEYTTRIEIADPLPAGELTQREQARLLKAMDRQIGELIEETIFGGYSRKPVAGEVRLVRSSLGVIGRDVAVS